MNFNLSLRARLLGTSALAAAGTVFFGAGAAVALPPANCSGGPLTDGANIVCSGNSYYSIQGNAGSATVTLNANGDIVMAYDPTIAITGNSNSLTLKANSSAYTYANGYTVYLNGNNNNVTLNDGAQVLLRSYGDGYHEYYAGIAIDGTGNTVTLNNHSHVDVIGQPLNGSYKYNFYAGVDVRGQNFSITLNGGSSVNVTGQGASYYNHYTGIYADNNSAVEADRPSIVLNGGSSINVKDSTSATDENHIVGIDSGTSSFYALAPTVTLNGGSSVNVTGQGGGSNGDYAIGIANAGVDARVTLNDGSSVNVFGKGAGDQGKYTGIVVGEYSYDSDVVGALTLNGGSTVTVNVDSAGSGSTSLGVTTTSFDPTGYVGALTLNGGSSVTVNVLSDSKYAWGLVAAGQQTNVTLNGGSSVTVNAGGGSTGVAKYVAARIIDTAYDPAKVGGITLNGGSSLNVVGTGGGSSNKYVGVFTYGSFSGSGGKYAGHVTLNDSSINLSGNGSSNKYIGVISYGHSSSVTLNGTSQINANQGADPSGSTFVGLLTLGDDASVTLNGDAAINAGLSGSASAVGIAVNGDNATVTLNDNASVTVHTSAAVGGGVVVYGDNAAITLNGNASIDGGNGRGIQVGGLGDTVITGSGTSVSGSTGIEMQTIGGVLNIAGAVTGSGGTAIDVSSGLNTNVTLDGAFIDGDILGSGFGDALTLLGHGVLPGDVSGFNTLGVTSDGIWDMQGTVVADAVTINAGTLAINGYLTASSGVTVTSAGTLGGSGTIAGTVNNFGTISPGNSPGTLNVVGSVTFNSGSTFLVQADSTGADKLNVTGAPGTATINAGTTLQVDLGSGVDGFAGDIVAATGGITGTFNTPDGTALQYTATTVSMQAVSASSFDGASTGGTNAGFTFLDTVMGQAEAGIGSGKQLWGTGLWQSADRDANGTTRGSEQNSAGGAFGGTVLQSGAFNLGLAMGYLDSKVSTKSGGARTSIDSFHLAAYGTYALGGTYLTAAATAAYQDMDVKRNVLSGGVVVGASGAPEAWVGGLGVGVAHPVALEKGFTLTPRASLGWQHMTREGYTESGGGLAGISVNDITAEALRSKIGADLSLKIHDPYAGWTIRPTLSAALARDWRLGDETASGTFNSTGAGFSAALDTRDQTYLAVGAGVELSLGDGITAFTSYNGEFGGGVETAGGVRLGARIEW